MNFKLALIALGFIGLQACSSNETSESLQKAPTEISKTITKKAISSDEMASLSSNSTASIAIEGMACEKACAGKIQKTLSTQSGVKSCSINFEDKIATVQYDDKTITEDKLISTIQDLNNGQYAVTKMEVEKFITEIPISEEKTNQEG